MADDIAIKVEHVSKTFRLPHEKQSSVKNALINFKKRGYEAQEVLKDISFEIKKGEFFGIVGRNGSGKSTLLKLISGIYTPTKGNIHINGKLTPFIELGVGFNPELSGRENVFLNGALLGFNRKEMEAMYDDIVAFAEIEKFMDQKLKNYSSGMQVRLAFSIAIRANTDILVLDEVLAVGDYDFQQKCFEYFKKLKKDKKTIVLVSHDMNSIRQFCDKGLHIREGKVKSIGSIGKVTESYVKENTERMMSNRSAVGTSDRRMSGVGDAVIEDVYTTDYRNEKKNVFGPGEAIRINFACKAMVKLEAPTFGMTFADGTGHVIFATNTLDRHILNEDIEPGSSFTVTYELVNEYEDGEYTISGAIASNDRTILHSRVENAFSFRSVGRIATAKAPYYPNHEITTTVK
jgi:ABC-2 type transport system ATP-binding protein